MQVLNKEMQLDKLLNINYVEVTGRQRIINEFKYVFRTFRFMRKFKGRKMDLTEI